ncbi:hypothetical protein [Methylocapsa acidiphila]|uniref:hypothetical protein n=1 Tax=Methylocapsa acidiphila TaxID=133552 RepID=UPI00047E65ED|nr:hypothetical protein [Methylocapsa acidiphila]
MTAPGDYAGGLVGANVGYSNSPNEGFFGGNTAVGSVSGDGSHVGGLVGSSEGGVFKNNDYHDNAANVSTSTAAAQQLAQEAATATAAANLISTTNVEMTAQTPPSGAQSTAGKEKVAAIAGPKIDDSLTIKESESSSAAGAGHASRGGDAGAKSSDRDESEEDDAPRPRRSHIAQSARKAAAKPRGAGYGAAIRHIEIDGQRFKLEDDSAKKERDAEPVGTVTLTDMERKAGYA